MNFVVDIGQFFSDYYSSLSHDFAPIIMERDECGVPLEDVDLFGIEKDDIITEVPALTESEQDFLQKFSQRSTSGASGTLSSNIENLNSFEIPVDVSHLLKKNEFYNNFNFVDQLETLKNKFSEKMPSKIKMTKEKLGVFDSNLRMDDGVVLARAFENSEDETNFDSKLTQRSAAAYQGGGNRATSDTSVQDKNNAKQQFEDWDKLFGKSMKHGKKCCGHAPNFRLYNPNTEFCDRF